jgi:hypothetical protein
LTLRNESLLKADYETIRAETRGREGLLTDVACRTVLRDGYDPDRANDRAEDATSSALVARVVPAADVVGTALEVVERIASYSYPAALMAKEAVNRAERTLLTEDLRHERRLFQVAFETEGQKEGMSALLEKSEPTFAGR